MTKSIAFLGPAGTYSEQACLAYDDSAKLVPFLSIPRIADAVESREVDEGVIPIENSLQGSVTDTLDLLIHDSSLLIRHELVLNIQHCLIAAKHTNPEKIRVIYSHPQALAQCQLFLSRSFPNAKLVASISTSAAVQEMLLLGTESAAIASKGASEIHGAKIISHGIEDKSNNMTRFVVIARKDHPPTDSDKTSICFSFDDDSPGILHKVLGEFSKREINLTKIESRPNKKSLGSYIFLVDLAGHKTDSLVSDALDGVRQHVSLLKIFGSYPKYQTLTQNSPPDQ